MLLEEDRAWFKELHCDLNSVKDSEPRRSILDREEIERIFAIVESANLLTVLVPHGFICGIGITIYEHEGVPKPELLLALLDDHIPRLDSRSVYEHIRGVPSKYQERRGGDVRQDVWELFTRHTHTPRNREWLAKYKIPMSFEKHSYDY
jgi:hypothetical protein